jgi:hypothetical protein
MSELSPQEGLLEPSGPPSGQVHVLVHLHRRQEVDVPTSETEPLQTEGKLQMQLWPWLSLPSAMR